MMQNRIGWRLGLGAEVRETGVLFRVWAPKHRRMEVVIEGSDGKTFPLEAEEEGYFSGTVPGIGAGARYRYRFEDGTRCPDPCSRFQPEGPHGPSMVVDPGAYRWGDTAWPGARLPGQVIYELHIGAFTPEGTFDAAAREIEELRRIGMTMIELMPVAEFPGRWNWGYDGVALYAPSHVYGDPEGLKRFVDAAHQHGMAVILDVVYNHVGPDGNYFKDFSDDYFTDRYKNEWGEPINFDGPGSKEVREFFIRNACYWIAEFHLDGLRLDATQQIFDSSPRHVLADLSRRAREAARPREIVLIGENESQQVSALAPVEKGGHGLDALWNDDFHHSALVALTGRRDGYFTDYRGEAQEFISSVKRGFLYQGQHYLWQKKPRGSQVTTEPAAAFVHYIQNHDQVANHLRGERLHVLTSPARVRAMTALLLLAPETPLLFMGQEFGASSPFLFFADHNDALAPEVHKGRKAFLAQFPSYATPEAQREIPDPRRDSTFLQSKLDFSEREKHAGIYLLHQDLLTLRREDPILALQSREGIDGAVLGPRAFALRFFGKEGDDRLLVVNLGPDLDLRPAPEPLLAPVKGGAWRLVWSSDDPRYGGPGAVHPCGPDGWQLSGGSALFLSAIPA